MRYLYKETEEIIKERKKTEMKKVGKKILTGVITAGMVLSAMSMSALADDGGGDFDSRITDSGWNN